MQETCVGPDVILFGGCWAFRIWLARLPIFMGVLFGTVGGWLSLGDLKRLWLGLVAFFDLGIQESLGWRVLLVFGAVAAAVKLIPFAIGVNFANLPSVFSILEIRIFKVDRVGFAHCFNAVIVVLALLDRLVSGGELEIN
jgi:hypothetical protein